MFNWIRGRRPESAITAELIRLKRQVSQQEIAVQSMLQRESDVLGLIVELCEDYNVVDERGESIRTQAAVLAYAKRRGDTLRSR